MIDLQTAYVRAYLAAVKDRITNSASTLEWAHGEQTLVSDDLIPPFPRDPKARQRALADWDRYKKQVQSLGPRILKTKRGGAIGDVNWGGKNTGKIDERLEGLNLRQLARSSFDNLVVNGVTAAWAYRDEDTSETRVQALGGYLEPIYPEDDPTGEIVGLYQAMQDASSAGLIRYRVRVYDLKEQGIREWRGLKDPTELDRPPTNEWVNTSVPRVVVFDTDQAGYPIGELSQALELLRAEVALQLQIMRVADAHAFPILYMTGAWDEPTELGRATVLRSGESGTAGRIDPGDMAQLFTLQDRAMERLRADLSLPIGSITTGSWPSGEALQQANVAYITSSQDYALLLSDLLTGVVGDYGTLEGISDPPPVTVSVNREQMRTVISTQVREDYFRGIVSLRMAVTAVAPYYPNATSGEIEEFIAREESPLSMEPLPSPPVDGDE